MDKRWNLLKADEKQVEELSSVLNISSPLSSILVKRGYTNYETAKAYFRPQLSELHDPFLMKDMHKAVDRLIMAINRYEKILVFGDYDVDGTTSVAVMYSFLRELVLPDNLEFYIPHRYREGYGVSKAGIDYAHANQFSLIISLDCGIKSKELIGYAKDLGIDFIVCDHHLPDDELPNAVAILNAKQSDCNYPYKELRGCGVGFKLITAIATTLKLPESSYLRFLDLVVTAIAADIVPLTGENRVLAYYGLKKINSDPCPGLAALVKLSGVDNPFTINNVVFIIAPRVNAAGRMDDARKAVELFVQTELESALKYAELLHLDNIERKDADSAITEQALAMIDGDDVMMKRKSTVVFSNDWHKGVVGIVASRLIEKYYRPTVVLTKSGEYVAGSARSVTGFNLYEAIHACREHLIGYGGHFAAAGLTLLPANVQAFSTMFEETVERLITPDLLIPEIVIDTELNFKNITQNFFNIICQMEPFGPYNMRPVFVARRVVDTGFSKIVKEQHIRFVVRQDEITLTGIGFQLADKFNLLLAKKPVDLVFTVDCNDWNGEKSLQLKVIDLRPSELQ